ncbi:hypothetical protein CBM2585_B50416 [Cupriavidus taiwanensis]|nr:hypothetical protein CBM2585_B50416 [Cupriavidus taiwanensis]
MRQPNDVHAGSGRRSSHVHIGAVHGAIAAWRGGIGDTIGGALSHFDDRRGCKNSRGGESQADLRVEQAGVATVGLDLIDVVGNDTGRGGCRLAEADRDIGEARGRRLDGQPGNAVIRHDGHVGVLHRAVGQRQLPVAIGTGECGRRWRRGWAGRAAICARLCLCGRAAIAIIASAAAGGKQRDTGNQTYVHRQFLHCSSPLRMGYSFLLTASTQGIAGSERINRFPD